MTNGALDLGNHSAADVGHSAPPVAAAYLFSYRPLLMAGSWGCILISDLDDTLVSSSGYHIADASLRRFNAAWAQVSGTKKLVYCTGRSLASFELLRSQTPSLQECVILSFPGSVSLPHRFRPDVLICSVGTEIYRDPASAELDAEWEAALEKGWNREALLALASRIPGLQLQPASEQRPYKISFHVGGEVRLSQTRVSRELSHHPAEAGCRGGGAARGDWRGRRARHLQLLKRR